MAGVCSAFPAMVAARRTVATLPADGAETARKMRRAGVWF